MNSDWRHLSESVRRVRTTPAKRRRVDH